MARPLPLLLDLAQLSQKRKPGWKVVIYNVRNGVIDMSDVVLGGAIPSSEYRDFTEDVYVLQITEVAGDYLKQGIAASSVMLTILDPEGLFDPRTGSEGEWLRQRNVVRIWEGDERVDPALWAVTFTGELVGQAGVLRSRAVGSGGSAFITAKALGREARYLRYKTTSSNFSQGTGYQSMATILATDDLQLDVDEIDFAGWGSHTTGHLSTQFIDENALVSIAKIMFVDGFMPRFNGEGYLSQTSGVVSKAPARVYEDDAMFIMLEAPYSELNGANRVVVKGLSADLTEILQPRQLLKTIDITTGYFARDEEIEVWWADDQSALAKNIEFVVVVGMNSGWSLGATEDWDDTPSTQGEGTIGGVLSVSTGYAPWILVFLGAVYVVLAVIPDEVLSAYGGGITISIGRLIQAIALAGVLLLMSKIGRGRYELYGQPFEYMFEEIVGIAESPIGLLIRDRREIVVINHLIQDQATADDTAKFGLFRKQYQQNKRTARMFFDLRLEPDDVFETADGRRFMIEAVKRTLQRNASSVLAQVDCYEVTEGTLP